MAGITFDFNANLARFSSAIDKATADLNKFQTNADRMAKNVKGIFGGLAAGLSVAAVTAFAKQTLDAADALNDMSQRTHVSVKDLASLRTISEQSGTSLEDVGKAIGKLNLSFSQAQSGTKEQAEALKRLGITSTDSRERFFQLADAYVETGGKGTALADIQKVLGKSYEQMIPLLSQGGEGLREAAAASESFADAMERLAPVADQFNDNMADLKTNVAGLMAAGLADMVPAVNQITAAMGEAYRESGLLNALWVGMGGLGTFAFTDDLDSIEKKIRDAESDVKDLRAALNDPGIGFMKYGFLSDNELVKRIGDTNAKIGSLMRERKAIVDAAAKGDKPAPGTNSPTTQPATKSDPLAGLLKSTDIGRMQEFDKTVALLNARFDYGRKSTELYEQAMAKLVESTFANNFKEAANDAEFMAMVQEDGAKTAAEWAQNLRDLANVDMGRLNDLLKNTDFARLKQDQEDMILLAKAFSEGIVDADGNLRKLSETEYLDAVKNRLGLIGQSLEEMDVFAKRAAENIVDAFGEFLFDPFDDGLEGMLQGFGDMIRKMIAQAVAADLGRRLFGDLVQGGEGEGLIGDALKWVGDFLPSFDGGGSTGMGSRIGGIDGKGGFLSVLHPNETVVDHSRGQRLSGGGNITINISGVRDASDVRRAGGQVAREVQRIVGGSRRYS